MNVETLQTYITEYGIKVILFAFGIIITIILAKWSSHLIQKVLKKANVDMALQGFISKLAKWAVLILGGVTCLSIFGIQTASFAAILAAAGFAVGLALQGTLSNFASGVMLLIFKPFTIGDAVNVAGEVGKVVAIDIFNTVIDTFDNRRIIIPNSSIYGDKIENITFHDTRRVEVKVGTDYGADIDQTRDVLTKTAQNTPNILNNPAPAVILTGLGGSSIDWSVRVWTQKENFFTVSDRLTRDIKYALNQANISIPFPQMDVHLQKEQM